MNGETDPQEIKNALREIELAALPEALAGIRQQRLSVAAMGDKAKAGLVAEIAAFVALVGGGWPVEQRDEFILRSADELWDYPASLVFDAVRVARKRVWDGKRFVSWVVERIEGEVDRLDVEHERLFNLARIAGIE